MQITNLDLRLFDGTAGAEGGAATAAAASAETAGKDAANSGENKSPLDAAKERARAKNPLSAVRYGKQEAEEAAPDAGEQNEETPNAEDPPAKPSFEELIKGEYKQAFDERVQKIINQRFRESRELKAQAERYTPLLDTLSQVYHVEDKDPEKLLEAIESDHKIYEAEAEKRGMTADQLREIRKMERQNAALKRALDERQEQDRHEEALRKWQEESEAVKTVYPAFELGQEVKNPQFVGLLRNGIDVRTAYEVLHKDEIISGAMQYTAQKVSEQVANNVKAKAARPAENGVHTPAGVITKTDVSKLTKADRAEVMRRAERGERIVF